MKRREFLIKSSCALSMTALAAQSEHFGLMTALAQKSKAKTENKLGEPDDYRALVCIYMTGGNDGNNMIIPNHNDANVSGYGAYSAARAAQGLALAQNTLLPISVPRIGNLSYGLHPAFGIAFGGPNNGLHELWAQQKMAAVTNVGTLIRPLTRLQYQQGMARPRQLFSHTDQTNQHQNANSELVMLSGWGGRMSDKLTISANPNRLIPTISSTVGTQIFTIGETTQPVTIGAAPTPLANVLALTGFNNTPVSVARLNALTEGFDYDEQDLIAASNGIHRQAIQISRSLNNTAEVTAVFPNSELGNQLKQIARLIKNRDLLRVKRQIFFCTIDGFDTHTGQLAAQTVLLNRFSQAARAFYDEMVVQGISDKVTQFTMSDFNRTFNPGGTGANVGSDHAWANHSFVIGGGVLGGDFYGMNTSNGTPFPTLVNNGPDDADSGGNARGRWIPTTSVEQYAGTLARWFGLDAADMSYVFPNIGNFQTTDLGFMSA